jgi:PRTRC genetic system protein F
MLQSCDVVHQSKRTGGKRRKTSSPAFSSASAAALALPRFKRGTKSVLSGRTPIEFAQLAMRFLEAGVLSDTDKGNPLELAQLAVSRWIDELAKNLDAFHEFEVNVMMASAAEFGEGDVNDAPVLMFGMTPTYGTYALQGQLEPLEKAFPGLGETALSLMRQAGYRTIDLFTPERARYEASYLYWYGLDSDEDVKEEAEAYDEHEGEFEQLPSWYDSHFPKWVISPMLKLDVKQLTAIATNNHDALASEVASLLIETSVLLQQEARFSDAGMGDMRCVHFSAMLRWNQEDPMVQVIDDYYEMASGASDYYIEECCIHQIPLETEKFLEWKKGVEQAFALFEKLDRLIVKIADPL